MAFDLESERPIIPEDKADGNNTWDLNFDNDDERRETTAGQLRVRCFKCDVVGQRAAEMH